jgi:DNA-binding NarL/FixJ family response regulator
MSTVARYRLVRVRALVLSARTIEANLRNIYTELGAHSRVELARSVERADRSAG